MTLTRIFAIVALAGSNAFSQEAAGTPAQRIVVSIADRKLALLEGDRVVKVYEVAVGKAATPTPAGSYKVRSRIANPVWFNHGKPVAAGKGNPLGTRWLGFSEKGHGIHGTNVPKSIGKAASHGCIRMRNADVEELFSLVQVGVEVEVRNEIPQSLAALIGTPAA